MAHCAAMSTVLTATIRTVDSVGDVGCSTSIAKGSDGLPSSATTTATNGDLKVAHCGDVTAPQPIHTLDSTGNVGDGVSLVSGGRVTDYRLRRPTPTMTSRSRTAATDLHHRDQFERWMAPGTFRSARLDREGRTGCRSSATMTVVAENRLATTLSRWRAVGRDVRRLPQAGRPATSSVSRKCGAAKLYSGRVGMGCRSSATP